MKFKDPVPARCVQAVSAPPHYLVWTQCTRKRGHGPNGEYCKQHAIIIERRAEFRRELEARASES